MSQFNYRLFLNFELYDSVFKKFLEIKNSGKLGLNSINFHYFMVNFCLSRDKEKIWLKNDDPGRWNKYSSGQTDIWKTKLRKQPENFKEEIAQFFSDVSSSRW